MIEKYKVAVVQAAPVFMDLDASIDKAEDLISMASKQSARIIAFSECWFPGYPYWVWIAPAAKNVKYFRRYHENSLVQGSHQFLRLAALAKKYGIYLSIGASEREYGTLYISQFLFDDSGGLLQARRKLKATHMERTVYGEGDGTDLDVIDTDFGRIGQLCCWEHSQPLTRFAMYSMHEQVHIAAWPSFSVYPGKAYSLGSELNNAFARTYAAEGQCYVLSPCGVVSQEIRDMLIESSEQDELLELGGGYARIYAPDGSNLCEPISPSSEGILFADIDLGMIAVAKSFDDTVGHCSRPDIMRLLLNRSPQPKVEHVLDTHASQKLSMSNFDESD